MLALTRLTALITMVHVIHIVMHASMLSYELYLCEFVISKFQFSPASCLVLSTSNVKY
jgi:hypothetical protein